MERPKKGQRYLYSMYNADTNEPVYLDWKLNDLADECGINVSYLKNISINGYTFRNHFYFNRRLVEENKNDVNKNPLENNIKTGEDEKTRFAREWIFVTTALKSKCCQT